MAQTRLDKYLSDAGIGTRSQVKQYIKKKLVTVNGSTATSGDCKIDPDSDRICYQAPRLFAPVMSIICLTSLPDISVQQRMLLLPRYWI